MFLFLNTNCMLTWSNLLLMCLNVYKKKIEVKLKGKLVISNFLFDKILHSFESHSMLTQTFNIQKCSQMFAWFNQHDTSKQA